MLEVNANLTTCEFVSPYAGYKPNDVWSGLEHLRTDEYVGGTSSGCRGLDDKGSGDASEETGAAWSVLSVFDHGFP